MSYPITVFLLARIAEDEAVANAAIAPDEMHPWGDRSLPQTKPEDWGAEMIGYVGGTWGDHSARWNPLRVLAECKAKRAIIELTKNVASLDATVTSEFGGPDDGTADEILEALAAVYAIHPDYEQEWTPYGPGD